MQRMPYIRCVEVAWQYVHRAKSIVESRVLLVAASQTVSSTPKAVWVFFTCVHFVCFVSDGGCYTKDCHSSGLNL